MKKTTIVKIADIANVDNKYLALSVGFKLWCVDWLAVAWGLTYSNIFLYFILWNFERFSKNATHKFLFENINNLCLIFSKYLKQD